MIQKHSSGIVLGIVLLIVTLLLCVDVTAALEEHFLGDTERNVIAADGVFAMFFLGIAIGVPAGILLFFSYLVFRERRMRARDLSVREMDPVTASYTENDEFFFSTSDQFAGADQPEEPVESLDPWEKPVDWWKHAEGDA